MTRSRQLQSGRLPHRHPQRRRPSSKSSQQDRSRVRERDGRRNQRRRTLRSNRSAHVDASEGRNSRLRPQRLLFDRRDPRSHVAPLRARENGERIPETLRRKTDALAEALPSAPEGMGRSKRVRLGCAKTAASRRRSRPSPSAKSAPLSMQCACTPTWAHASEGVNRLAGPAQNRSGQPGQRRVTPCSD